MDHKERVEQAHRAYVAADERAYSLYCATYRLDPVAVEARMERDRAGAVLNDAIAAARAAGVAVVLPEDR